MQLSYRSYVAVQLWGALPVAWFGVWHWLSVLGIALCYAAFFYNMDRVMWWASSPARDYQGRFLQGKRPTFFSS